MHTTSGSSVKESNNKRQTSVQIWFRAPKLWNDFLEEKAAEELCTKSDLMRHAFRIAFGREIKEFRVNPKAQADRKGSYFTPGEPGNQTTMECFLSDAFALVPRNTMKDSWIESMAAFVANKRSLPTQRVYRLVLKEFFLFVSKHPSNVKQSDIIRYRHQMECLGRAPSTIGQHLAAISGYYNFCISRNLTLYNPVRGVNRPLVSAYTGATWLNKIQAKALLSQPNRNTIKGRRDYAILLTLLLTGLRRSELVNIRRRDIQERGDKLYLTYVCKGGAKIVRDIPRRRWEVINDYLITSDREIKDDSPLFTAITKAGGSLRNYYGHHGHNGHHPITPEAIRQIVAYYSRSAFAGEIRVSPHTLRHTAGTLLRESGRSIEEVQSFLKHKRIDTTQRYLHIVEANDSELGECIAKILNL